MSMIVLAVVLFFIVWRASIMEGKIKALEYLVVEKQDPCK